MSNCYPNITSSYQVELSIIEFDSIRWLKKIKNLLFAYFDYTCFLNSLFIQTTKDTSTQYPSEVVLVNARPENIMNTLTAESIKHNFDTIKMTDTIIHSSAMPESRESNQNIDDRLTPAQLFKYSVINTLSEGNISNIF